MLDDMEDELSSPGNLTRLFRYNSFATSVLISSYVVILICGLVGNALVIAVVHHSPRMRTTTNYLLVNLAVADILVLLVCVPANLIANILLPWLLGNTLCKLIAYLQNVTVSSSINTLIAISIDRYMAICRNPLRRQCAESPIRKRLVIIWTLALVGMSPTLVYQNQYLNEHYEVPMCGVTFASEWAESVFFLLIVVFCYWLPLLTIILSYCCIFHTVWTRHFIGEALMDDSGSQSNQHVLIHKSKVKVLRMVCTVVIVFFVFWAPLYLLSGYITLFGYPKKDEKLLFVLFPLTQLLGLSNSAINPVIYAYFNKNFRQEFVALFRRKTLCQPLRGENDCPTTRSRSSSIPLSVWSRRFTLENEAKLNVDFLGIQA